MNLKILFSTVVFLSLFCLQLYDFGYVQGQPSVNSTCMVRGESNTPPPFLVILWEPNGACNSTIDHFLPFYDIRSIIFQDGRFIMFLES